MDFEEIAEAAGGEPETPWDTWVLGLGLSAGVCLISWAIVQLLRWSCRRLKKAWKLRRAGSPSSTPVDPNSPSPTSPLPAAEELELPVRRNQSGTTVEPAETVSETGTQGPMIDLHAPASRSRLSLSALEVSSRASSGIGPPRLFLADGSLGDVQEAGGLSAIQIRDPRPSDPLASLALPEYLLPPAAIVPAASVVPGSGTSSDDATLSTGPGPCPKS